MQLLRIGSLRAVRWYLSIALAMTVAWGVMQWLVAPPTGLTRVFYLKNGEAGERFHPERTSDISLAFLEEDPTLFRRGVGRGVSAVVMDAVTRHTTIGPRLASISESSLRRRSR